MLFDSRNIPFHMRLLWLPEGSFCFVKLSLEHTQLMKSHRTCTFVAITIANGVTRPDHTMLSINTIEHFVSRPILNSLPFLSPAFLREGSNEFEASKNRTCETTEEKLGPRRCLHHHACGCGLYFFRSINPPYCHVAPMSQR